MQKKTLLIVLLCLSIITVFLVLSLTSFRSKEAVSMPQTPEEALKDIIKKNIKQEFLSSTYQFTQDDKHAYATFGPKFEDLDYYLTKWKIGENYFVALVAYDKTKPKNLIGYGIDIYVKEPDARGKELAPTFLTTVPTKNWKHTGPKDREKYETGGFTEISSVFSKSSEDETKIYLAVISYNLSEPQKNFYPFAPESVKNFDIIKYIVYMPNTSSEWLEFIQQGDLESFGSQSNE